VAITGNASALTAKLTLTHIQNSDAANYDVVATNATGSIVSNLVVLAVNAAPPIITNRPLTATGTVGNSFSFSITASSSPTRFSAVPLPPGLSLNSATGVITGVPTVVGPTSVTLGATGAGGTGNAILTLTVVAAFSPSVVQQPVRQTVAYGAGAAFSIAVAGNPAPTLQWQRLAAGSALWQNVVEGSGYQGVTSAILTVSSPTPSMSGDQFRAVITNSGGSTMSNPVALTVVGTEAKLLHFPAGLASDAAGNLYVANSASNTIDKISPGGVLSTLAGSSGVAGTLDGAGAGARFNQPGGITIDSTGTLFVADSGNGTIRRITPAGIVTTLAGSPFNRGNLDGLGGAASFGLPIGIAVDSLGNLYVADAFNATIRKITSAGSVSTFAGEPEKTGEIDGTGSAARFNYPCGVAVNATGIVYVADTYNHTLRKVTPAGVVTTFAGSAGVPGGNDGAGRDALFNQPVGLAVDINGNLYVADTGTGTIRLVSPNGAVITMAGTVDIAGLGDGPGGVAFFNQPRGITLDDRGYLAVADIYVADTGNALIRRITPDNVVSTLVLTKTIVSAPETGSETATPQDPEPRIIQKPKPVRGAPDPMDP
jgi:sugar lactone lactonase YvrE